MAQLPLSSIVNVNISVSPSYSSSDGFGTLMLVTKETGVIGVAERYRSYSDIDGVAEDWATDSEVYKAATSYFSQSPQPTSLMVGMRFEENQSGELRGGYVPTTELANFQAISSGGFTIAIDGSSQEIVGMNFSGAADMDAVAAIIEAAVQAIATGGFTSATVIHNGSQFIVTSGTTGVASTLSWVTAPTTGTDISDLLGLLQGEGTKSDGFDAENISTALTAIQEATEVWYGLMFTKEVRDDVQILGEDAVLAAAAWCEARIKVLFTVSNNELCLSTVDTSNIMSLLMSTGYKRTFAMYSSYPTQYPEASVAGRAFTVQFTASSQAITLKFKLLPGITVETLSTSQKSALDAKYGNALISIAGNTMLAEGYVSSGVFFDEVHGLDWLENEIQSEVFAYMYTRTTKVPFTDPGIQGIAQRVRKALDAAVTAGFLAAGTNDEGTYLAEGYIVYTVAESEVSTSDKEDRTYTGVSFTALGAGAIHGVTINGVFER